MIRDLGFLLRFLNCIRASGVNCLKLTCFGSTDDIGWAQKDVTLPEVRDETHRFLTLLERIKDGQHELSDDYVYILISGLFSNHGPLYFVNIEKEFRKLGLDCHIADVNSEAPVETNAREVKEYIEKVYWDTGKRVVLLCHSKGGVDAAAACAKYWPDLSDKVAVLVCVQCPYGGSPLASDIFREGLNLFKAQSILGLGMKFTKGDLQSVKDLTYEARREFIARYPLPEELCTVSFCTEARTTGELKKMSHVGDLKFFSSTSKILVPLEAMMAVSAQYINFRYKEENDGLVTCRDAEVPGSILVRPMTKLHHGEMVFSSSEQDHSTIIQIWIALAILGLENYEN